VYIAALTIHMIVLRCAADLESCNVEQLNDVDSQINVLNSVSLEKVCGQALARVHDLISEFMFHLGKDLLDDVFENALQVLVGNQRDYQVGISGSCSLT
jgi:hypothetical protein